MRVTHVITRLIVGGAQENTVGSVLGLRLNPDVEVNLISGPASGPEGSLEPQIIGVPNLLTILPELVRPIHPWKDVLAFRRLTAVFHEQRPEIVHTHSGKAGILGRLAAHRAGVPIIVHTIHGPSFGRFQNALANALFVCAERYAGKFTTHFVAVARAMTDRYLAAGIGRPVQYTRIFSGFPLQPFLSAKDDPDFRQRLGIGPDDCDGAGEICLEDETGFLLQPGDLCGLTERLLQLVRDGALRERLGRRGQQLVKQWFPIERMVDELYALYFRLMKKKQ